MIFEAYRISRTHYQIFTIDEHGMRRWLGSFNGLRNLIIYYIHCHNLTGDELRFTGTVLDNEERLFLGEEDTVWGIT